MGVLKACVCAQYLQWSENGACDQTGHCECGWQWRLTEKPRTMALGFDSSACTDSVGAGFVWRLTYIDQDGGVRFLDFQWGGEPWLLWGLEKEGEVERGREKGGGEEVDIFNK